MAETFRGWLVDRSDGAPAASLRDDLTLDLLQAGDVDVEVAASTINYKDGLAVTGRGKIIRTFPCVPGIDLAGTVIASRSERFKPGDEVVLNGFGVGERHSGGLAERARVKAEWLLPLPPAFTAQEAMAIGTAGYTAMLSVLALEANGVATGSDVLVTGAAGGVGSVALTLLAQAGFRPIAVSGRPELESYLKELGAAEVLPRAALLDLPGAPLASAQYPGAIDTVGSAMLANLLKLMAYEGTIAACGLAGGFDLPTTVMPFILRGVRLIGIESVYQPVAVRERAWARLADLLPKERLALSTRVVPLQEVDTVAAAILDGQVRGRTVVDVKG